MDRKQYSIVEALMAIPVYFNREPEDVKAIRELPLSGKRGFEIQFDGYTPFEFSFDDCYVEDEQVWLLVQKYSINWPIDTAEINTEVFLTNCDRLLSQLQKNFEQLTSLWIDTVSPTILDNVFLNEQYPFSESFDDLQVKVHRWTQLHKAVLKTLRYLRDRLTDEG